VERARAFTIPADRIEESDVQRIYDVVKAGAEEIRAGRSGPRFLECPVYRWKEHVGPNDDYDKGYRSLAEAEPWFAKDQLKRLAGLVDPPVRSRIEREVEAEIKEAFEFAERSPFPPNEELWTDVFMEAR
jgi:TPP-dependent pyruvate/acetoin dehydrogenase alpha subunit